ncbi:MAG TPA: universal stress protein [Ktedonobacteraceae bacterium]|nr:universal stress protein [Ktedonobacteraceae bacterium]
MSQDSPEKRRDNEGRPDPELLLRRYGLRDSDMVVDQPDSTKEASDPRRRGRLRVYLGAAAGVGKTYAMLNEGHRRKTRGTDAVIGYVESHKRAQTQAQVGDLEIIPRKKISYRGVTLEEMDTEAIIARHPQIALIDELAHTNVAGLKNRKRYQDVEEILNAGINVVTTLNVQHLESLNDLVASITGVQVRETLPDRILDMADEVELVDIDPNALRQRMKHGNIYPTERIEPALSNFFREGNLTALREIALRLTAEKAESQLQVYMTGHGISKTWGANERVLVGFDDRPHSRQVLRDAWRLSHGLHADLVAVYIRPQGYRAWSHNFMHLLRYGKGAHKQRAIEQQSLEEMVMFAEDLGAEVIRRDGADIASGLLEAAQENRATQLVLGQPMRTRLEELIYGSVVNRLLRLHTNLQIHLVPLSKEKSVTT